MLAIINQLEIERLYSKQLQEKQLLNGKVLENATNALLEQYLQNGEIQ